MSVVCNFHVKESAGIRRNREPIKVGIPFQKGKVKQIDHLLLVESDFPQICNFEQTAVWPDGSLKWALLDFFCSLEDFETKKYEILYSTSPVIDSPKCNVIEELTDCYSINTQIANFHISKEPNKLFHIVSINGVDLANEAKIKLILTDENNNNIPTRIRNIYRLDKKNLVSDVFVIEGDFDKPGVHNFIDFKIHITFYVETTLVKWNFEIHNKDAAQHPGGTWDLGDPGSVYFNEIKFEISFNEIEEIHYRTERERAWRYQKDTIDLKIYQESSGGKNWRGNNHKNRDNLIPMKIKGYQVYNQGKIIDNGIRATPYVHLANDNISCSCTINKFWQNFPKSFDIQNNSLSINIFPEEFPDIFELQGGEKKTHTFYLNFNDDFTALDWVEAPIVPQLSLWTYINSGAFPYISADTTKSKLLDLILSGIEDENNFFVKREIVDEYGWRNFGDLYADHEAVGCKGDQPLVSHYNNQYDPIMGFATQYIVSGNPAWFELMDDLAKHVVDIDIYHTTHDRDEYNNGLFWHTDHYLDAHTCTHRTFSKEHNPESYLDYQKGGGPANEHCYTTGLLYHYYLTGTETSKQALLQLCEWMIKIHSEPTTLLGIINSFLKKDLRIIRDRHNGKKYSIYKYPLSRGTGNYINTLLDAYFLTNNRYYLGKVEHTIKNTIHPYDDICNRGLSDIEHSWSYTVLLQSLYRYLHTKEQLVESDDMYLYTRDSFNSYAKWMLDNEVFYLDKHEELEHPNLTWVAQEIRKSNIFFAYYFYSEHHNEQGLIKANLFLDYCVSNIKKDENRTYTRILVLLMQNFGPDTFFCNNIHKNNNLCFEKKDYIKPAHPGIRSILSKLFFDLIKHTPKLSIKNELNWLILRNSRLSTLLKKFKER